MTDPHQIAQLSPERRRLLELLRRQQAKLDSSGLRPLARTEGVNTFPLSFAQQRLWFIDQLQPGTTAYTMLSALRLTGPLDEAALLRALNQVVARHESLRTTFIQGGPATQEQPVQVIAPHLCIDLPVTDLTVLSAAEREAAVQRGILAESQQPFDLTQGPLLRATLLRLARQEHVLILTLHHIIADGWSQGVLIREVTMLYRSFAAGQADAQLPPLPVQYADYAVWQRQWLHPEDTRAVLEQQLAYWRKQLRPDGLPPPKLQLLTDHPRAAVQTITGARQIHTIPPTLSAALAELSQREGATLFMTLLTAFQILLARYTGQDDITVGSGIANRTRAEIEGLIGFFVNTLVLRTDLSGNPSFREALARVREVTLAAYAHQDLPFEKLVEELQPERDLNAPPLCQVLLTLQNTPLPSFNLGPLRIELLETEHVSTKVDLDLSIVETAQGLRLRLQYNAALFEAATIARMLAHFQHLLEGIVAQPDCPIAALPLLTDAEQQQILHDWNATVQPDQLHCFQRLFEAQVGQTPDAVAVVYGGSALTYAELDRRANQLAHYVQALGVGPEVRVGLSVARSLDLIVGMLGILKAGGAYVPLDPAYPAERLRFMLADARIGMLVTQAALTQVLPKHSARVVCLDADWPAISQCPEQPPTCDATPENIAYVIYTSGSTGRPKGVLVSHRGLGNLAAAQIAAFGIHQGSRVLQWASFSFDAAVSEITMTLLNGATLVLAPDDALRPGPDLVELLREQAITTLTLPPSALAVLPHPEGTLDLPHLEQLIIAGEVCPPELVERWRGSADGMRRRLFNAYGPTETTVCATIALLDGARRVPPIGRPIANTRLYLVSRHGYVVPIGVPGEIYIGGVGLAHGYQNRPDLTAERFVPDPFSTEPGARLYRTGDLARYLPDGSLEFLGRIDQQVKLRGFRIELAEIEARLNEHPAVRDALVLLRDERLVAYVVAKQNKEQRTENQEDEPDGSRSPSGNPVLGSTQLRAFLKDRLPDYMVPSAFVVLDGWPLTPNGKLDRAGLPAPDRSRRDTGAALVGPRTPTEELIAGVWSSVLGISPIGVHDNFFALGGHSLLATQAISRLRALLSRDLPLRLLFEAPTIAGFAARLGAHGAETTTPLQAVPRDGRRLPLSFAQQRLWFLGQLEPDSSAYTIPVIVRLSGGLNHGALVRSLSTIVQRHEILRTTFASDLTARHPDPYQQIAPDEDLALPVVAWPADADEATVRAAVQAVIGPPFDLQRGPLLRVTLFQQQPTEHLLVLAIHHSIFDGWSQRILIRELTTLYAGLAQNTPVMLPELPIQYADYAVWQRQWLSQGEPSSVLAKQLDYWRQQLAGAPPLELPADYSRPLTPPDHGAHAGFTISAALTAELQRLSQQLGSTLFMTLLAAFQTLLYRYSGQSDITVGTPIAGRVRPELEDLIGFFVNTLVLRTNLAGAPSFADLVARVRATALDAYAHQDIPFELVVETVQPERDLSHSPLFRVMFIVQQGQRADITLPGLIVTPVTAEHHPALFDLTWTLRETAEGLQGQVSYRPDLFDAATIDRLMMHYQALLRAAVADPQQSIDHLDLLTDGERQQLLVTWNGTAQPYPADQCLHQLVEAQVARTPAAIALRSEREALTYAELNARANQLAHQLQSAGVVPDDRVGLCLDRGCDLVIGLLAILKAGAAYVPLDPDYPQERLAFMVDDARIDVLVTQESLLHHALRAPGSQLLASSPTVVCLDRDAALIARQPTTNPQSSVTPQHLAYVIYTSGSTGQPKGTLVEHRQVVNTLWGSQQTFGFTQTDVQPWLASVAFDIALFELFNPLLVGGTTLVLRREEILDLQQLGGWLRQCTLLHAVPTLLRQIVQRAAAPYPTIRQVFVGGEAVPPDLLQALPDVFPHAQIQVLYGPTEASIICTQYAVDPDLTVTGHPIGRPLPNHQVRLYDKQRQLVPVGVVGELYVGGAGVTRGYLHRPELTAEKYVVAEGQRWYRTGDLARWRADGVLEFAGRLDDQVKLRGFRIELGEIETVLRQHEAVHEAIVVVREDLPPAGGQPDQRLVAYVVQEPAGRDRGTTGSVVAASPSDLRAYLQARLPAYMLPSAFVVLDALPLTANGKLDRRALPKPDLARPTLDTIWTAPSNPVERALASVWQQVLGLERVGVHDNFFALGGDSFLGLRVIAQAKQVGVQLTPRALFQHQTIRELAAVAEIEHLIHADQHTIIGPIESTPNHCEAFETYDVERQIWNIVRLMEVDERLNPAFLKQVTAALLEHHDALRLRSAEGPSGWYQCIAPPGEETPFTLYDFSELLAAEQHTAIETTAAQLQKSLNLQSGPTLRVALFDLGPDKPSRLLLLVHHTVCDGYSSYVVLEDFHTAYAQLRHGEPIRLPRKTTSLAYYAQRLVEYTRSGMLDHELHYWVSEPRKELVPIPVDYPGIHTGGNARAFTVSLSAAETQGLRQALSSTDIHVQEVLLTAVALAFVPWMGPGPFLIDIEQHGRDTIFDDVDLSRTVGWLNYRVPLVVDLRGRSELASALQTIQQTLRELPNHGIGFGLLYYVRQDPFIAEQMRAIPRARVLFNYRSVSVDQGPSQAFESRAAKEFSGIPYNLVTRRRHLLLIDAEIVEGKLSIHWTYSHEVHRHDTIDRVAQTALAYLRSLIPCIDQSLSGTD